MYTAAGRGHPPFGRGAARPLTRARAPRPVNTPTHVIASLALLGRRGDAPRTAAAAAGAVLPDVPIFALFVVARLVLGQPSSEIWTRTYFEPGWQLAVDLLHSVPLALAGLGLARWRGNGAAQALFASMLLHSALDLPVHTDDAHRHLLPVSDWRFHSPISYWDPRSYGREVAVVEIGAALLLAVRVYRMLRSRVARAAIAATALLYAAGAVVLLRPCLGLPWLAALGTEDPRCAPPGRAAPR